MELLAELCETCGVSGREERLRAVVRREMQPLAEEIRTDALGNLIAVRRGRGSGRLAIMAHMDEIGFLVSHVEEKGFLRLVPIGGHDTRNMVAQRVTVCGERDLPGLLYPGIKPHHLSTEDERKRSPSISDFFVDVGLPADEVRGLVPVGTPVVIARSLVELGQSVSCKALDDRVAVYVMIEAVRRARPSEFTVCAVATTQEEVGCRGALTAAYGLEPDVGLALDVTIAADIPGVPEHERVTCLGDGPAIKIMDSNSISHPRLVKALKTLAERRELKHQLEILPRGGTDAGPLQRTHAGIPAATISVPTRYVHTSIEMAHRGDIEAAIELTRAFIEEGHEFDLAL